MSQPQEKKLKILKKGLIKSIVFSFPKESGKTSYSDSFGP